MQGVIRREATPSVQSLAALTSLEAAGAGFSHQKVMVDRTQLCPGPEALRSRSRTRRRRRKRSWTGRLASILAELS
jgi:hypothetical protein